MKRILYFDWHEDATSFYRLTPLAYLNLDGCIIERSTNSNISFASLIGYDAIIIERPSSGASLNIIKMAKDLHIKVIIDYDDDVLHIDQYNPMYELYQSQLSTAIECIIAADEVWVSTEGVKKSFRLYNKNIHVINNAHNDYVFKIEDKKVFNKDTKTAVWRGGGSHEGDMYDIGVPELIIDVVNNNPDWTFKFIGQRFKYLEKRCGQNYIAMGGASTIQFYKMLHEENPNVVFYPLADTIFNKGKSNICWMEATYAGSAFCGSNKLPEYSNDSIFPIEILNEVINAKYDMVALKQANKEAWENICDNYLLSKINKLREERLLAI